MTLYAAWSDEAPAAQNHFNWLWVVLAVSALVIAALVVLGRRNGMRRGGHRTEGASRRSRREENNE